MTSVYSAEDTQEWIIESIRTGPEIGDSTFEIRVSLQEDFRTKTRFVFQFFRSEDGAGTIYKPGRRGTDAENKVAVRDNRAAFEAAQAIAEETGTRVETVFHSQHYLNSIAEESVADLIGKLGERRVRELLEDELELDEQ